MTNTSISVNVAVDALTGSALTRAQQINLLVNDLLTMYFDLPAEDGISKVKQDYADISLRLQLISDLSTEIINGQDAIQGIMAAS